MSMAIADLMDYEHIGRRKRQWGPSRRTLDSNRRRATIVGHASRCVRCNGWEQKGELRRIDDERDGQKGSQMSDENEAKVMKIRLPIERNAEMDKRE
jgi:hypothetical protein